MESVRLQVDVRLLTQEDGLALSDARGAAHAARLAVRICPACFIASAGVRAGYGAARRYRRGSLDLFVVNDQVIRRVDPVVLLIPMTSSARAVAREAIEPSRDHICVGMPAVADRLVHSARPTAASAHRLCTPFHGMHPLVHRVFSQREGVVSCGNPQRTNLRRAVAGEELPSTCERRRGGVVPELRGQLCLVREPGLHHVEHVLVPVPHENVGPSCGGRVRRCQYVGSDPEGDIARKGFSHIGAGVGLLMLKNGVDGAVQSYLSSG